MDLLIRGNKAIITGGASGIGLATAKAFAAEGCHLALWDFSPRVNEIASELATAFGVDVSAARIDVVDGRSVSEAMSATLQQSPDIHHLVHCAAMGSSKFGFPFTNLTPADWPRTLEVNIMGMVNVAHAVTPHMTGRKRGTMVFLASVAGQIGSQTDPPYSASKAANINFAQCMAKDLAGHGIRVNTICPGMVQTPLNRSVWQAWHDQAAQADRLSYEEWTDRKIRNVVPLGSWQTPEDIADMIVFLSSERARQVTGQTINVDGGFVMHW